MKSAYFILFLTLIFATNSFSQTGTIRIAKAKVTNQDSIAVKRKYFVSPIAGVNYTFKKNSKIGYNVAVLFPILSYKSYRRSWFAGVKYSRENQYYKAINLTSDNVETDYLSLPLGIESTLALGVRTRVGCMLGLTPEYQIKFKSADLKESQFNPFNVSANLSLLFPIGKRLGIQITYSKDIFDNLKNKNIYNSNGDKIGSQQSRTDLIAFAFICTIFK